MQTNSSYNTLWSFVREARFRHKMLRHYIAQVASHDSVQLYYFFKKWLELAWGMTMLIREIWVVNSLNSPSSKVHVKRCGLCAVSLFLDSD